MQIRVQVLNSDGSTVGEQSPNSEGLVRMRVLGSVGSGLRREYAVYRIRVFGAEIDEAWLEDVEPGRGGSMVTIQIHRKGDKEHEEKGGGATVSAASLAAPPKAQNELEKGNDFLAKKDYVSALAHFQKATDIYPKFDQAWNNLGVVKVKMGDTTGGQAAFQKALDTNDKFARAYVNLARIDMMNHDYAKAGERLTKSLSLEPLNPDALSMSCEAALIEGKTTEVVSASVRLHSLPHEGYALCHFAAGLAYTNLNKPEDAVKEYEMFVKETPGDSALVQKAQANIAELNKQSTIQK